MGWLTPKEEPMSKLKSCLVALVALTSTFTFAQEAKEETAAPTAVPSSTRAKVKAPAAAEKKAETLGTSDSTSTGLGGLGTRGTAPAKKTAPSKAK
jgi:hypothetical protein